MRKDEDIFDVALSIYAGKSLAKYPELMDLDAPLNLYTEDLLELAGAEAKTRAEAMKRYHVEKEPFELFNATAYFLQNALLPAKDIYRILGLRRGATLEQIERNYRLISSAFFKSDFDITSNWKPDQIRKFTEAYKALVEEAKQKAQIRKQELENEKLMQQASSASNDTVIIKPQTPVSAQPVPQQHEKKDQIPELKKPAKSDGIAAGLETIILDQDLHKAVATPVSDSVIRQVIDQVGNEAGSLDEKPASRISDMAESSAATQQPAAPEETFIIESADLQASAAHGIAAHSSDKTAKQPETPMTPEKASDSPDAGTIVRSFRPEWFLYTDHKGMPQNEYPLKSTTIIGRNRKCDIVIPSPEVSRQHVQLEMRGNQLYLTDLGSTNGTFINDQRVNQGEVCQGDVIRIDVIEFRAGILGLHADKTVARKNDQTRLYAAAPPKRTTPVPPLASQLQGLSDPVNGAVFNLSKDRITIGRNAKNDIVIKDSTISSVHAEIVKEPDGWHIRDMESLNGVYVNGKKQQSCLIKTNDNLRFGRVILELTP